MSRQLSQLSFEATPDKMDGADWENHTSKYQKCQDEASQPEMRGCLEQFELKMVKQHCIHFGFWVQLWIACWCWHTSADETEKPQVSKNTRISQVGATIYPVGNQSRGMRKVSCRCWALQTAPLCAAGLCVAVVVCIFTALFGKPSCCVWRCRHTLSRFQ